MFGEYEDGTLHSQEKPTETGTSTNLKEVQSQDYKAQHSYVNVFLFHELTKTFLLNRF